jgi:toxin ParE1/3/4
VRLTFEARRDLADILEWTTGRFGPQQAAVFAGALTSALMLLANGPDQTSARRRDDIKPGLWSLHLATVQPRSRHLIFYRVAGDGSIAISRVLHESMDPRRHLPGRDEDD